MNYRWTTFFQAARQQRPNLRREHYLKEVVAHARHISMHERVIALMEENWFRDGRPYYNIQDNIVGMISRMDLSRIPARLLEIPRDHRVVVVQFPLGSYVQAVLAGQGGEKHHLYFAVCLGRNDQCECIGTTYVLRVDTHTDDSIETVLEGLYRQYYQLNAGGCITVEFKDAIALAFKAYCTIKFLADVPNEQLMEFDICSRYKGEWEGCISQSRRHEIIAASKKRGRNGWNIGVNCRVIENCPRLSTPRENHSTGRSLQWAQLRQGHIHAVRFGEGKSHVRLMLYRPTTVRPDLPFKHDVV